ncbi:MAG: TonB family protein [Holophagales bacterium]|nr:TonB family protein [Holophagales bacterium]
MPPRSSPLFLALLLAALPGDARASDLAPYRVVVNAENPTDFLTRDQLSSLFLRKVENWRHGVEVEPVELASASPERAAFTHDIHDRSLQSIQSYWQRQVLTGRKIPPLEAASDAEVLEQVRSHAGAIGYVSADTRPVGVKEVGVAEEPVLLQDARPLYPARARRARVQGLVVLEVEVDETGRVAGVEPRNQLSHGLTSEAIRAVRRFLYEPASYRGRPVPVRIEVAVRFSL